MQDVQSSPSKETTDKDLVGDHMPIGDGRTSSSSGTPSSSSSTTASSSSSSSDGSSSTGSRMIRTTIPLTLAWISMITYQRRSSCFCNQLDPKVAVARSNENAAQSTVITTLNPRHFQVVHPLATRIHPEMTYGQRHSDVISGFVLPGFHSLDPASTLTSHYQSMRLQDGQHPTAFETGPFIPFRHIPPIGAATSSQMRVHPSPVAIDHLASALLPLDTLTLSPWHDTVSPSTRSTPPAYSTSPGCSLLGYLIEYSG
jgi:hypothetical protein